MTPPSDAVTGLLGYGLKGAISGPPTPIFLVLFASHRSKMAGFLVKPGRLPKSSVLTVP